MEAQHGEAMLSVSQRFLAHLCAALPGVWTLLCLHTGDAGAWVPWHFQDSQGGHCRTLDLLRNLMESASYWSDVYTEQKLVGTGVEKQAATAEP